MSINGRFLNCKMDILCRLILLSTYFLHCSSITNTSLTFDTSVDNCKNNTDYRGLTWPTTSPGEVASFSCSQTVPGLSGSVERKCGNDSEWRLPLYNCIRQEFLNLQKKVDEIISNPSSAAVKEALTDLTAATDVNNAKGALYEGELKSATNMLESIASVSDNITISKTQSKAFVGTASNLLDTSNHNGWQSVTESSEESSVYVKKQEGAPKVLQVIDKYATSVAKTVSTDTPETIQQENIVLHIVKVGDKSKQNDIHFPSTSMNGLSKSSITLGSKYLNDVPSYSAVLYKNLTGILPSNTDESSNDREYEINSAVLSLDLHKSEKSPNTQLEVKIVLVHFQQEFRNPLCSFWNTETYAWDSTGCTLQSSNATVSVCKCSHLTNFAILMSPWTDNVVSKAIDIISIVGCSVSLIGLIITIVAHLALWRFVKSDRVVVLLHLSVALVVSYAIFIGGVDRTENKGACTAVAVLLQYIYLVVFFLMLAEGIELAFAILYVFTTKSRIKWILPLAWIFPAVLVGISVGATKTKGYGTEDFCWLSVDDGLIWSFIGPAVLIIMINSILMTMILRKMFTAKTLLQKSTAEKIKTGVRGLCIMIPLMGCSWILGLFYVNKDFAWVQYVFAVCNSLQGLVIFIFHCAMNQQIRSACQRQRKKYYDSRSMSTTNSKPLSLPRVSTSFSGSGGEAMDSITSLKSYDYNPGNVKGINYEMRKSVYGRN